MNAAITTNTTSAKTLYKHPDGPELAFKDGRLIATGDEGLAVYLPIGPDGLTALVGTLRDICIPAVRVSLCPLHTIKAPPKLTPRQSRLINAFMQGPLMREAVDKVTGSSNGPNIVAQLREKGLDIPCTLIDAVDRDGNVCRPGRYELSARDRERLATGGWLRLLGA